jgi:hypothetical protein
MSEKVLVPLEVFSSCLSGSDLLKKPLSDFTSTLLNKFFETLEAALLFSKQKMGLFD